MRLRRLRGWSCEMFTGTFSLWLFSLFYNFYSYFNYYYNLIYNYYFWIISIFYNYCFFNILYWLCHRITTIVRIIWNKKNTLRYFSTLLSLWVFFADTHSNAFNVKYHLPYCTFCTFEGLAINAFCDYCVVRDNGSGGVRIDKQCTHINATKLYYQYFNIFQYCSI